MARKNEKYTVKKFNKISIGLASPESILGISKGEVLKPETINYRTHKPERDGLFCERIFGPVKDFECACGKYKRIRYKGIVCDRCGVEVTEKKVRRDRVGHINLVVPVAHIWYFRSLPNKMGYLLGLPSKKLDMIIYYERYVVIQPGIAKNSEGEPLQKMDFLTEEEYLDILETLPQENTYLDDSDPTKFIAKMGAECLIDLLARIDLDELSYELRHKANTETSKQRKAEALKRLNVVEAFRDSQKNRENRPEWMIMKVVPVIPPELRPLVPLDGGRFATSDLNDLYRRVIIRNNRLKRLMEIKAPEVILRNEKRMLQESVDSLFDNTRKSSAVKTESNRPLKSLSDSLKGKQGRFRQNLLGKRVDYSARSVIVVGPELKLSECGIPKEMAAELYKPFVIRKLIERGIVKTVKSAKKIIDRKEPVVWEERRVAEDSRILINSEGAGVVEYVDANKITIKYDRTDQEKLVSFDSDEKSYDLIKFRKTNQGTCINLKPIVSSGDRVEKGQVLCEGYATQKGELALGRNMKVAFMPWKGYNFEDAIVISEKVVREDIFTSIHIDEYSLDVRDTKLGTEELTNDIPNVSEEATKDLDENGMIRIGAEVNPGDILIGKITPKGESDPTPEEKLLRAIFGDKAGDVKDASLKASPSLRGVVIDKKLFRRAVKDKTKRIKDKEAVISLESSFVSKFEVLKENLVEKLFQLVSGKTSQGVFNDLGEEVLPKGKKYTLKMLNAVDDYVHLTSGTWTTDSKINSHVSELIHNYKIKVNDLQGVLRREKFTISVGDELPAGILKLAKIYVAKKRKLKVGDKMAGRHGNKGIVARIVRQEDMPFLEDGTPVDIVLNPLGVPSRMNIGQIYETVLGWAGQKLDRKYATPIFDGASLDQINGFTDEAQVPRFGHTYLYDGGTGKRFDQPATVGVIYMIKLGHMIEDKMHARSIGPYSLITQQPLGGKAQFGGQRFGEMEVWALEAYGASSILREILTVKSDDVMGRAKTYESIVKGETMPEPGLPESFNVLMHELKGLGLDLKLEE